MHNGVAREMNLVQSVVEAPAIRGEFAGFAKHLADTACFWLVLLAAFWWTIERWTIERERGWPSERRAINYVVLRRWPVLGSHENIARHLDGQSLFRDR